MEEPKYKFHRPVLLNEVIELLNVQKGKWYIDATAGGGGHTRAILEKKGKVLVIDQDEEAISQINDQLGTYIKTGQLQIQEGNFKDLGKIVEHAKFYDKFAGIIFDLGMSTYQIKDAGRGFSFLKDEPLDMRMSRHNQTTAADIVNKYSEGELYEIFRKFGEEQLARQLARAIVGSRAVKKIQTTGELAELAKSVYKKAHVFQKNHPGTRIFQALRIKVNSELDALRFALPQAFDLLEAFGRLVIISFHSLEDRIVKQYFLETVRVGKAKLVVKKPVTPSEREIEINAAARSAKLRVLEKS